MDKFKDSIIEHDQLHIYIWLLECISVLTLNATAATAAITFIALLIR